MVSPRNIRNIGQGPGKDENVENDSDYLEAKRLSQLHMSEISVITNGYEDVFSDFDPRSYEVRELSDDFLREVRRASRQKGEKVELKIMVPRKLRNERTEHIIRHRVCGYFKDGLHHVHSQLSRMRNKSIWYLVAGMALMLLATYVSSLGSSDFVSKFLFVFFDPAGWFIFWTGLDILFVKMAEKGDDHEFYRKLSNCDITFVSY